MQEILVTALAQPETSNVSLSGPNVELGITQTFEIPVKTSYKSCAFPPWIWAHMWQKLKMLCKASQKPKIGQNIAYIQTLEYQLKPNVNWQGNSTETEMAHARNFGHCIGPARNIKREPGWAQHRN